MTRAEHKNELATSKKNCDSTCGGLERTGSTQSKLKTVANEKQTDV